MQTFEQTHSGGITVRLMLDRPDGQWRVEIRWPQRSTVCSSPTREVAEERIEDSLRNSGHVCDPQCDTWRNVNA
jgi:hypothetical protein